MNKGKKLECKKSIIRNPEHSKPKTVVIEDGLADQIGKCNLNDDTESEGAVEYKSEFQSPELNSALRIGRKIHAIENVRPRKVKSVSDLDKKNKIAVDERVAKKVNFPYDKHIYKDLMPLCVRNEPQPLQISPKEIIIHKDKEPVLSDFYTPEVLPEYSFEVPVTTTKQTPKSYYDGFKLYRVLRNCEDNSSFLK